MNWVLLYELDIVIHVFFRFAKIEQIIPGVIVLIVQKVKTKSTSCHVRLCLRELRKYPGGKTWLFLVTSLGFQ